MYSLLGILALELVFEFMLIDGINANLSALFLLILGLAVVVMAHNDGASRFMGLLGIHYAGVIAIIRLPAWLPAIDALSAHEYLEFVLSTVYLAILPLGLLVIPIMAGAPYLLSRGRQ